MKLELSVKLGSTLGKGKVPPITSLTTCLLTITDFVKLVMGGTYPRSAGLMNVRNAAPGTHLAPISHFAGCHLEVR